MRSGIDDLLLNLKLQLLALPSLARWGLLVFAGIVVLREAIGFGWGVYQRRKMHPHTDPLGRGTSPSDALVPDLVSQAATPAALPAPDPLAQASIPVREGVKVPRPGDPSRPGG